MSDGVTYDSHAGRGVLAAAVLGSGMALLDGTVVNVALKRIGSDLGASLAELQWITNAYLLALASLILIGGSLGDRLGRRRVFVVGVVWFTVASVGCGAAPSAPLLIGARALQGVGAALLTPGSLAMIQGAFRPDARARAIGAWAGLGGIVAAIGPFLGGWLVQYASWRWVFFINVPLAVATVVITARYVPETQDAQASHHFDLIGATLAVLGLGGVTFALIEANSRPTPIVTISAVIGIAAAIGFILLERAARQPMMPTNLFASRQFSGANAMTLVVYGALGAMLFFLVLQLQTSAGYGPLQAGVATLPITVVMLFLASRGGALASRIGPRLPMALGPLVCAAGIALLTRIQDHVTYWVDVFPGVTIFALGLALLVAPLTATVLAAAPDRHAGIASGINNAVARGGSLLAVAALPTVVGLHGEEYANPLVFGAGYRAAMWICVVLLTLGAAISWLLIRNPDTRTTPAPPRLDPAAGAD
ncbi:MAG: MFS transporter [Nocardioidaceae bacterium]